MTVGPFDPGPRQDDSRRAVIDDRARKAVERFSRAARGVTPRHCPVCGYHGMFTPYGMPPRLDAHCAGCGSLERHRLYALLIQRQAPFGAGDSVLHFAAEHHVRRLVEPLVGRYETAEMRESTNPTHVLDITDIDLPDASYTRIICNHVLEHVDDAAALSELFRILAPGGMAFLTTPVVDGWPDTYENPDVDTRQDRILHFGQQDHVRVYGRDLRDRVRAAGFDLSEFIAVEPDVHRHGLWRGETIFVARRPDTNPS